VTKSETADLEYA